MLFEAGVRIGDGLLRDVAGALLRCARWHGCPQIRLVRTEPADVNARLAALLGAESVAAAA